MIPRYTRPEMEKIWNERNEWQTMLDVEIAACEANAELGRIPKEAVEVIKAKADFDVDRIHEIDKEINHDIIAFLSAVAEYVGDEAKYIHMGLTSTDVKDTGLNVQVKQASDVILKDLEKLAEVLKRRAVEFKYVPTIGRTHGVHAEPTTFGLKLLLWYSETLRNIERMKRAAENMCVGKLSGIRRYPGGAAGSSCGIYLHVRRHCRDVVPDGTGSASPAAYGSAGSGRIFQPETERLLRHAPQTEPGAQRAHLRHGPAGAGLCAAGF